MKVWAPAGCGGGKIKRQRGCDREKEEWEDLGEEKEEIASHCNCVIRAWNNKVGSAPPSIQYKYSAQPCHLPLSMPDQKQLRSRESKDAKMKVSYVAAFLIGLLSLESTRAAPLVR